MRGESRLMFSDILPQVSNSNHQRTDVTWPSLMASDEQAPIRCIAVLLYVLLGKPPSRSSALPTERCGRRQSTIESDLGFDIPNRPSPARISNRLADKGLVRSFLRLARSSVDWKLPEPSSGGDVHDADFMKHDANASPH
jgi:hypothetical protein